MSEIKETIRFFVSKDLPINVIDSKYILGEYTFDSYEEAKIARDEYISRYLSLFLK